MSNGAKKAAAKKSASKPARGSKGNPRNLKFGSLNFEEDAPGHYVGWMIECMESPKGKWWDVAGPYSSEGSTQKEAESIKKQATTRYNENKRWAWHREHPAAKQTRQHVQINITPRTTKKQLEEHAKYLAEQVAALKEAKKNVPTEPKFDEVPEFPKYRVVKVTAEFSRVVVEKGKK